MGCLADDCEKSYLMIFRLDEIDCPRCEKSLLLATGPIPKQDQARTRELAAAMGRLFVTPGSVGYPYTCPSCEARLRVAGYGPD